MCNFISLVLCDASQSPPNVMPEQDMCHALAQGQREASAHMPKKLEGLSFTMQEAASKTARSRVPFFSPGAPYEQGRAMGMPQLQTYSVYREGTTFPLPCVHRALSTIALHTFSSASQRQPFNSTSFHRTCSPAKIPSGFKGSDKQGKGHIPHPCA